LLVINTDKTVYQVGDNAYIQMGVLDGLGHTLCSAKLDLTITDPNGGTHNFNTDDDSIVSNSLCGPNNYILTPEQKFKNIDKVTIADIKKVIEGIESNTKISVMVDVGRVDIDDVKQRKDIKRNINLRQAMQ